MRELNWKPEQSVALSVLGDGACAGEVRILELSGKRMHVGGELTVKTGAAVRLEWDGQLVLGDVLNTEPSGFWIEIRHMLLDTTALTWQRQGWQR
jgi:hypothetical protein